MLTQSFNCCVVVRDVSPNFSKSQLKNGKYKMLSISKGCHIKNQKVGRIERVALIYIYTLLCVKQLASEKLLYSTGSSAWCSVMT